MELSEKLPRIRPAAVAGRFYPADPGRLKTDVSAMLGNAAVPTKVQPKALIAPHAGYQYSGEIAARAFQTIRGHSFERVALIGPAHFAAFRGIAVPSAEAFLTPLGSVQLDKLGVAIAAALPFVTNNDAAHAPEHALEVELPFLQIALGPFVLVPLLVGEASPLDVGALIGRLWGGPETLIVVSSDLSHFNDYETAYRLDSATAALIETGSWRELNLNRACGALAVAGLLIEAERRGLRARRLALCNSGDTSGIRDRVVGYGAWLFGENPGGAE